MTDKKAPAREFDIADQWLSEQGIDVSDLNKPFYIPDMRVAFIYGRASKDSSLTALQSEVDSLRSALESAQFELQQVLRRGINHLTQEEIHKISAALSKGSEG